MKDYFQVNMFRSRDDSPLYFDTARREYQLDVFKMAMRRNTIAHHTGVGKTMIAIMIIKQVALCLTTQPSEKKLIIFLAPTRNLVEKIFKVLKENTDLTVDFYHGTKVGTMN